MAQSTRGVALGTCASLAVTLSCFACGGEAASGAGSPGGDSSGAQLAGAGFSLEGDFVALEKGDAAARGVESAILADRAARPGMPVASADFYLAIKRSVLSQRWFLTAFMKQFYPGNAGALGDADFGSRVVSFEPRGDRLMMLDTSDRFKASAVGDPELLIEAYPIVSSPVFEALPGAGDYVLIDPSRGLNDISVAGNVYNDPTLPPSLPGVPLRVGLSFTQNVRVVPDGVAFEEVFAGDLGTEGSDVWGTLGITLRRYSEGEGYVPTADPGIPYYFSSGPRLVPDSGGQVAQDPVRWNFHRGMKPVQFFVSAGAQRAQADNPGADLIGALRRGIESWNDVLGFRALEAVFLDDDVILDNDQSSFVVDYPGEDLGYAFASWRTNPNTGEVRGGSVYFSGVFFDFSLFQPAPADEPPGGDLSLSQPFEPSVGKPSFSWGGVTASKHLCELPALLTRTQHGHHGDDPPLTPNQQGERFVQSVAAHEVGHILGLRHNFKGSLVPPTSSLMEYSIDSDTVAAPEPGPYDVAAIRYLYQLSTDVPTQPFCTDDDTTSDPLCAVFDSGADPLHDWYVPRYSAFLDRVFAERLDPTWLGFAGLNELLAFARDFDGATNVPRPDRSEAVRVALGRSALPLAAADAANPEAVETANSVADLVLRRLVLDPVERRGSISFDVTDPDVIALIVDQSGRMLRNEDGARSFALRRTAVDVLHALQTDTALVELSSALDALKKARSGGELAADQRALQDDLIARTESALSPYYP